MEEWRKTYKNSQSIQYRFDNADPQFAQNLLEFFVGVFRSWEPCTYFEVTLHEPLTHLYGVKAGSKLFCLCKGQSFQGDVCYILNARHQHECIAPIRVDIDENYRPLDRGRCELGDLLWP